MDILKILSSCPLIDANPVSDSERDKTDDLIFERKDVHSEGVRNIGSSKKKKIKVVQVRQVGNDEVTVASIIQEKPSKKVVSDFLRMRIAQLVANESD